MQSVVTMTTLKGKSYGPLSIDEETEGQRREAPAQAVWIQAPVSWCSSHVTSLPSWHVLSCLMGSFGACVSPVTSLPNWCGLEILPGLLISLAFQTRPGMPAASLLFLGSAPPRAGRHFRVTGLHPVLPMLPVSLGHTEARTQQSPEVPVWVPALLPQADRLGRRSLLSELTYERAELDAILPKFLSMRSSPSCSAFPVCLPSAEASLHIFLQRLPV